MVKSRTYSFTGKRIPDERISEVWSSTHPRTKQPAVKGYYSSQREINRVNNSAIKHEHTQTGEYGPRITANPSKYNRHADGLCFHGTKSDRGSTILIQKGMPKRSETAVIKHELNHIYDERRRNMRK